MSVKSHDEHQTLITSCISDIHAEFDGIFKVLVEDRSYGNGRKDVQAQTVDLPHIRRLFDSLLKALTVLQAEAYSCELNGVKKKVTKAMAGNPYGFINVEEAASVPLRLLRVNTTSNPKQARADKRLYDELIQNHLSELHCFAWKVLGFLFGNVEMGTEVFERELAALTRDQIKSDLKTFDSIGKGSECALNHFNELIKSSTSFNGQVFICEMISSGILIELSTKSLRHFASLLRSGPNTEEIAGGSKNKKARYHQASESDQKRLETARAGFTVELESVFASLSRTFGVFESSQGHLNPQDHVTLTENILAAMALLFQSQHNYKSFVMKVADGEYLRVLVTALSFALVSFQPAYLPPFLPLAMRLLSGVAGRSDSVGLAARRALLQVELIIHPRRAGPVTYRPASEAVRKVFERSEPLAVVACEVEEDKVVVVETTKETVEETVVEAAVPIVPSVTIAPVLFLSNVPVDTVPLESPVTIPVEQSKTPATLVKSETIPFKPARRPEPESEDDEPMPQIVDSGPDDN